MRTIFSFFVTIGLIGFLQAQTMINKGVTCADKKAIVNYHNDLRRQIANGLLNGQPKSSDMLTFAWDDDLETLAQTWADRMIFEHRPVRTDSRFSVGENIYMSMSDSGDDMTFNWNPAILKWFNEYPLYKYAPIGPDDDYFKSIGHYTQVAWATTKYVGCGVAHFKGTDGWFNKFYVCNYGPSGNMLGEYPYKTGAGCETLCCQDQCSTLYGKKCT